MIARNHHGVLTAKSVSGEVTASGEFSNIRANTVSGDLSFDLHGFTHDFGANSVSGDVTIRLPHDVGVDIVAKSASGAVVIDDQKYAQPGGKVQTIAGPGRQADAGPDQLGVRQDVHLPRPAGPRTPKRAL